MNISGMFGVLVQREKIKIDCDSLITGKKLIEEKCLITEFATFLENLCSNICDQIEIPSTSILCRH